MLFKLICCFKGLFCGVSDHFSTFQAMDCNEFVTGRCGPAALPATAVFPAVMQLARSCRFFSGAHPDCINRSPADSFY